MKNVLGWPAQTCEGRAPDSFPVALSRWCNTQHELLLIVNLGKYLIDRSQLSNTTLELKIQAIKDSSLIASSESSDSYDDLLKREIKAAITTAMQPDNIPFQNILQLFWESS